jgi:Leucine-rich repeat (LRR) protein
MDDENFEVDHEGYLDVRYNGWTEVDSTIFSLSDTVLSLDLSFNRLLSLPDDIGCMVQLTRLNCSCNALESIPSSIGNLILLKELKMNGNKLSCIPDDIGKCQAIKTLYLNENKLRQIPDSIRQCRNLVELHLQNNRLVSLPFVSLSSLQKTLEIVNVANNPDLSIIPQKVAENTKVIMWILIFLSEKTSLSDRIRKSTMDTSALAECNKMKIQEIKTKSR